MSRVHRRAGIAEHRRRTAEQVRIEQTRPSSRGGAVVQPAPELPASALQPHPAHVCSAARVCARRCRRCLWLALWLGCGFGACGRLRVLAALGDDGELGQALGTAAGTAGARQAGGSGRPAHSLSVCAFLPQPEEPLLEERWGRGGPALLSWNGWWETVKVTVSCGKIRYLRGLELRRESAGALLIRAFTPRSTDPLLHTLTFFCLGIDNK